MQPPAHVTHSLVRPSSRWVGLACCLLVLLAAAVPHTCASSLFVSEEGALLVAGPLQVGGLDVRAAIRTLMATVDTQATL